MQCALMQHRETKESKYPLMKQSKTRQEEFL